MRTSVIVCADRTAIATRARDLLIDGLRAAVHLRGRAHLALTGGSSAAALFEQLREGRDSARVEWPRVHVWQGDERFVPLSHPDSNWAAALREWLEAEPEGRFAGAQRHPIVRDEDFIRDAPGLEAVPRRAEPAWGEPATGGAGRPPAGAERAAARYAAEIERRLPRHLGLPSFDVLLLGVGADGHILSAFPDGAAISEEHRAAVAVPAPDHIEPHLPRVTLAPALLRSARSIVVMVPGSAKAEIVARCFGSRPDPKRTPAQLAIRPNAVWLLDRGSAAAI